MATSDEKLGRRPSSDPLLSSTFGVRINGISVGNFAAVDGLAVEYEMIEYRSSEDPNAIMYRQGRRKPGRVTLKRGLLVGGKNNELLKWISSARNGELTARDIEITVGGAEGEGSKNTIMLIGCRPAKWSLGALEGTSNSLLMESIELVCTAIGDEDTDVS